MGIPAEEFAEGGGRGPEVFGELGEGEIGVDAAADEDPGLPLEDEDLGEGAGDFFPADKDIVGPLEPGRVWVMVPGKMLLNGPGQREPQPQAEGVEDPGRAEAGGPDERRPEPPGRAGPPVSAPASAGVLGRGGDEPGGVFGDPTPLDGAFGGVVGRIDGEEVFPVDLRAPEGPVGYGSFLKSPGRCLAFGPGRVDTWVRV